MTEPGDLQFLTAFDFTANLILQPGLRIIYKEMNLLCLIIYKYVTVILIPSVNRRQLFFSFQYITIHPQRKVTKQIAKDGIKEL